MFTVGIFTTHIPYVAFVVFYAWFLIFGVDKASKGEVQIPGKSFTTEYQVIKQVNSDDHSYHYSQSDFDSVNNFATFLFKPKIKHRALAYALFHQFGIVSSLSNRPPPHFS